MFKHVIHEVSITSVLDRRRANANGYYPVRIVVNFQREKKYYTTGKVCSEEVEFLTYPAQRVKIKIKILTLRNGNNSK